MLSGNHKGLFEVIKAKNNESINFFHNQKLLDFIEISLRFSPNENNCKVQQQIQTVNSENSENIKNKNNGQGSLSSRNKKKTNSSENDCMPKSPANSSELPYFYITATYS